ncbi:MAG: methyltransferase family protein [Pseudomonadota bacterium]
MMPSNFIRIIDAAWILAGIVWAVGRLLSKQTARAQSPESRVVNVCLMALVAVLLCTRKLRYGPLAWRFVPASSGVAYAAVALTLAGVGFAIWARFFLGRNWSGIVTIKQDHSLVRRGPYAVVRHPIYSGFLLAALGTALAQGEVRGLVAVALALIGLRMKSRLEETFLLERFGATYAEYTREVKALIPFVW